jgi:phosphate-selective porin OprO/OprP
MDLAGGPEAGSFDGGYVQFSWVPTGERYRYSRTNGYSTGIRPRGRFGALELSTRLSTVDLEEGIVTGGEQHQWTAGVSWYAKRRYRVMLNYGVFLADPNRNGLREDGSIVSLRLQAAM